MVPLVRQILAGDDSIWKHWVLQAVVGEMETSVVAELEDDLRRLAAIPRRGGRPHRRRELLEGLRP